MVLTTRVEARNAQTSIKPTPVQRIIPGWNAISEPYTNVKGKCHQYQSKRDTRATRNSTRFDNQPTRKVLYR